MSGLLGNNRNIKIALKYCGCCNPKVNLTSIARYLSNVVQDRGDFRLVPLSEDDIDVVVILCGCPRSCGNKVEVRARAKRSLIVAGESLSGLAVPEADLPAAVARELNQNSE